MENYYTMILNRNEEIEDRLFLYATDADAEISRLHGVIQAQAGAIIELQTAIHEMAMRRIEK